MSPGEQQALEQAITRNVGLVLSLPSAGALRHFKSRFLADESAAAQAPRSSSDEDVILIESVADQQSLLAELIGSGQPCGISFKLDEQKVIFASPILAAVPAYSINATTRVDALRIRRPTEVKAVQRRGNYRVAVPQDAGARVRLWRIAERAYLRDRPQAAQEVKASLRDLSNSGMGLMLHGHEGKPPLISSGDRLRIIIEMGEDALLLEGRMRHPVPKLTQPEVRAGIEFQKLNDDLEGRKAAATLARLVGELQRAEARRYRMGITQVT